MSGKVHSEILKLRAGKKMLLWDALSDLQTAMYSASSS